MHRPQEIVPPNIHVTASLCYSQYTVNHGSLDTPLSMASPFLGINQEYPVIWRNLSGSQPTMSLHPALSEASLLLTISMITCFHLISGFLKGGLRQLLSLPQKVCGYLARLALPHPTLQPDQLPGLRAAHFLVHTYRVSI